jgi:hypothetical protein
MRYLPALLAAVLVVCFASPATAQQEPTPEHKALDYFLGEWTYEFSGETEATGEVNFRWFGDGFFLHWHETFRAASVSPVEAVGWIGYDAEGKHYTWTRFWANGNSDTGKGWKHGDTWTFVMDESHQEGKLTTMRTTWTVLSPQSLEITWERSVEGQAWELTDKGKVTKVK